MELEKMNMWKYGQTDVFEFIVFKSVKQWYNVLPPQKKKERKKIFIFWMFYLHGDMWSNHNVIGQMI